MSSLTPGRFARSAFWVTLAYLILELALWLVLPKVLDAAFPEAEGRADWVRIAAWVLTLVWVLWMGVLFIVRLARTRWAQRLLGEGRGDGGPLAEALQALEQRMDLAEDALARLGPLPGGRPRPWLLMVGPRGAGKSASVRGSELSVFVLDPRNSPFDVAPSQSCDWLHCGDAVVMDTAGRYTTEPQGREEWLGLLRMVARRRGGTALDAVVVTVSLPEIVLADGASARLLGERLRRQLDDVVEILGYTPPAHLLLTHLDGLDGFHEFFRRVPGVTERPWGHAFPAAAQASVDLSADFNKGFSALVRNLEAMRLPVLSAEHEPGAAQRVLLFPAQLTACRPRLSELVRALTAPTALPNRVPLVGFWLGSARAQGPRVNLVGPSLDGGLGLQRSAQPVDQAVLGHGRPHFLKPLFASLLTTPSTARLIAEGERLRRRRQRRRLYVAALLMVTVGGGGVLWFGVANLRLLGAAEAQISGLQEGLTRRGALIEPSSLARALVLGDLVFDEGPAGDHDDPLLTWAYGEAALRRPGWWRRIWVSAGQVGLEDAAGDLLGRLARRRVIEPAASLLQRELEVLDAADVPDLASRRPGTPLAPQAREWATRAWTATELADRWAQLRTPDPAHPLDEAAGALLVKRTAQGIGALLERMRGHASGGDESVYRLAGEVESILAEQWLGRASPSSFQAVELPDAALVRRVRGRLSPVDAGDLLYSVSLEETGPPGPLDLQSAFLRWSSPGRLTDGPHGFTAQGCADFEQRLEQHAKAGTFAGFKGVQGAGGDALGLQARNSYTAGYLEQWLFWVESFKIPERPATGGSLGQLPDQIDRIYRTGDGDLEVVLSRLGRGAPLPAPTEGEPSAASTPSPWCTCQVDAWWLAASVTSSSGALRKPLSDLQSAMLALGDALETLPQDAGARQDLVRDTFAQKGVLFDAFRANSDLLRAVESARPTSGACGVAEGDSGRKQQISNLVEQVGLRVLNQVWWLLLQDYQQQADRAWREEIGQAWARLANQYPLDPRSTSDADAAEIKALIGTSGSLDAMIDTWLSPLLDQGAARGPLWQPAPHLQLSDAAMQMVRARPRVGRLVDQIDASWDVTFKCIKQENYRINRLQVLQDGQELLLCDFEYNKANMSASVTVNSKVGFRAALQGQQLGGCLDEKTSGDWALYRGLQRGLAGGARRQGVLTYTGSGCTASWGYEEGRDGPAATFAGVSRLGLPDPILVLQDAP